MASKTLSADDLALGRAVLLATDSYGVSAEGAFWLYHADKKAWRYYLISSLFNKVGSRELYLRLNEAFAVTLSENEARDFGFFIADPDEPMVKEIRKQVRTSPHVSKPIRQVVQINKKSVPAVIYRLASGLGEEEANRVRRRFRQRMNELRAV